jgi:hypothetical protein
MLSQDRLTEAFVMTSSLAGAGGTPNGDKLKAKFLPCLYFLPDSSSPVLDSSFSGSLLTVSYQAPGLGSDCTEILGGDGSIPSF